MPRLRTDYTSNCTVALSVTPKTDAEKRRASGVGVHLRRIRNGSGMTARAFASETGLRNTSVGFAELGHGLATRYLVELYISKFKASERDIAYLRRNAAPDRELMGAASALRTGETIKPEINLLRAESKGTESGDFVADVMEVSRMGSVELAMWSGMDKRIIERIVSGITIPSDHEIAQLAKGLKLTSDEIQELKDAAQEDWTFRKLSRV